MKENYNIEQEDVFWACQKNARQTSEQMKKQSFFTQYPIQVNEKRPPHHSDGLVLHRLI
jgi:hypothetical protein